MTTRPAGNRRQLGAAVEAAARDHLVRAGLREVAANANFRGGELDLVMLDTDRLATRHAAVDVLVFIEVRYRRTPGFGGGAMSVDAGKQRKLVHAAHLFLQAHPRFAQAPCRFDVIEAGGDADNPSLHWIRDAFRADGS